MPVATAPFIPLDKYLLRFKVEELSRVLTACILVTFSFLWQDDVWFEARQCSSITMNMNCTHFRKYKELSA